MCMMDVAAAVEIRAGAFLRELGGEREKYLVRGIVSETFFFTSVFGGRQRNLKSGLFDFDLDDTRDIPPPPR